MRVLDSYGDDYRAGQFTFVLEVSVVEAGGQSRAEPGRALSSMHPNFPSRMKAARAPTPPLPATQKMSLRRKMGPRPPEGHPYPANPAARHPERGPADGRGGEHPVMAGEGVPR